MTWLIDELLHFTIGSVLSYFSWARHREGIPAKLLAFAIPVVPTALLVWLIT